MWFQALEVVWISDGQGPVYRWCGPLSPFGLQQLFFWPNGLCFQLVPFLDEGSCALLGLSCLGCCLLKRLLPGKTRRTTGTGWLPHAFVVERPSASHTVSVCKCVFRLCSELLLIVLPLLVWSCTDCRSGGGSRQCPLESLVVHLRCCSVRSVGTFIVGGRRSSLLSVLGLQLGSPHVGK